MVLQESRGLLLKEGWLVFFKQRIWRDFHAVLGGLGFAEQVHDFLVTLQEIESFLSCNVEVSALVLGFLEQFEVSEELEIVVELGEAEVSFVHDLGFECAFFADLGDFRDYVEFVSAFTGNFYDLAGHSVVLV
jgi:hypothetical protein